jgi:voltage-gated potassium channel
MTLFFQIIVLLLSPTRLVINRLKDRCAHAQSKAHLLLKWNRWFFQYDILIAFALCAGSFSPTPYVLPQAVAWLVFIVACSRCNEIVMALLHDVNRELDLVESSTALTTGQRIKMAMRSYVGLFINFGALFYFLSKLFSAAFFAPPFDNFVDALYFSGVTITTLGYGDIKPDHIVTKMLVLYELFSGLLLLVVALSVYLSAHSCQRRKQ